MNCLLLIRIKHKYEEISKIKELNRYIISEIKIITFEKKINKLSKVSVK